MADIMERLGHEVLIIQGVMDEALRAQGFADPLAQLNLTEPEVVSSAHQLYRIAGADCAITNTAGATSARLAPAGLAGEVAAINEQGVRLAREEEYPHVLARVTPCGVAVEAGSGACAIVERPAGAAGADAPAAPRDASLEGQGWQQGFAVAVEQYAEQIAALASAAPDAILLTGFTSADDALAACLASRRVTALPVLASMTVAAGDAVTDEAALAKALVTLARAGVDAVGCDGLAPGTSATVLADVRARVALPLFALPLVTPPAADSLRLPRGRAHDQVADRFAAQCLDLVRAGACAVGSSGGSTPAATGALYAEVGGVALDEGDAE